MRGLSLYCGVGAGCVGLTRAGHEMVGIDWEAQPDYPYGFVQADVRDVTPDIVNGFDFCIATPPCQDRIAITAGNRGRVGWTDEHVNLVPQTRALLEASRVPWVIECGVGKHLRRDLMLCGEMFGLGVLRHRWFEFGGGWEPPAKEHLRHRGRVRGWRHGEWTDGPYLAVYGEGGGKANVEEAREAMGIDWTWSLHSLVEAVPPAYTEFIGRSIGGNCE
jgi:hypothetical protein